MFTPFQYSTKPTKGSFYLLILLFRLILTYTQQLNRPAVSVTQIQLERDEVNFLLVHSCEEHVTPRLKYRLEKQVRHQTSGQAFPP